MSEECEEFVCIRPASGHSDETGVQLPVGFLRLARAFRRGSVLVYAVLGEKVRTDMQYVVALESRLCRNAEKAAESIGDVRLPDFYLEKLNEELENLGPGPERCSLSSLS